MRPSYLHVLQHQPFQPLLDHPVDHVSQVGSFLRDNRRDAEVGMRTEKGSGSEVEGSFFSHTSKAPAGNTLT